MQRFFTVLTMPCLMLTFFVLRAAHADDPNGDVEVARDNEQSGLRDGNTAYENLQNAHIFYILAKAEYEANEAKIKKGAVVTAAKLLAETTTIVLSGGALSPPVAVSSLVDLLGLAEDIVASTHLLVAYEAAILKKQSAIQSFESAKTEYNNTYDTLITVLATHTGWDSAQEVFDYIAIDENRKRG